MNETLSGWAKFWVPEDTSAHGHGVDLLIDVLHWFMLILFVAWGIFFVYSLIRFRARANPTALYEPIKAKLSKGAEIGVVIFEIILLVGFSMPVWAQAKKKDAMPQPEDNPLTVRVVAQQFQWNVHYAGPDGLFGKTSIDLVDPVENPIGLDRDSNGAKDDIVNLAYLRVAKDRPVIVRLTTLDVIHSFWIPAMRVKQDTVPGMEIPIWFTPEVTSDSMRARSALKVRVPGPTPGHDPETGPDPALKRFSERYKNRVLMQDYAGVSEGTLFNFGVAQSLQDGGITEVVLGRLEPMEIQCAQLCGLNHFSMRGFFQVMEPAEWEAWHTAAAEEALEESEDDWGDWEEEEED